jgi:rhodanese-related sulfurtransferase
VARILIDRGYKLVRPLAGGYDEWVKAGFAVEEMVTSS